jgi:starch synthase
MVPWYGGVHCTVHCGWVHGRLCFFIEPHSQDMFFDRGVPTTAATMTPCGLPSLARRRWSFYCKSNKRPDVIHCHDWQTGLVPVMLYEMYQVPRAWTPAGAVHHP